MCVKHRMASISTVLLGIFLITPAWGASLNESIKIGDGETASGASTVNGSITVGNDAVVTGTVSTGQWHHSFWRQCAGRGCRDREWQSQSVRWRTVAGLEQC